MSSNNEMEQLEHLVLARLSAILGETPRVRRDQDKDGVVFYVFGDNFGDETLFAIYEADVDLKDRFPDLDPLIEVIDSHGRTPSKEYLWEHLPLVRRHSYHSATTPATG